ncbi:MAG: MotA/TolQ/ExbB proton channel family protein [Pseudomonadota bacterium]
MRIEFLNQLGAFMEAGGDVLWAIAALTFLLWTLISERLLFLKINLPSLKQDKLESWKRRSDKSSWKAHRVREQMISEMKRTLAQGVSFIKTLVALCPLLGLLGTVTGMVTVFDIMAVVGTGNPRSMASGISMATIPTMAGMVVSISGIYFKTYLEKKTEVELEKFSEELTLGGLS